MITSKWDSILQRKGTEAGNRLLWHFIAISNSILLVFLLNLRTLCLHFVVTFKSLVLKKTFIYLLLFSFLLFAFIFQQYSTLFTPLKHETFLSVADFLDFLGFSLSYLYAHLKNA